MGGKNHAQMIAQQQKRGDASLKRLFIMSRGLNKDLTQVVAILKPGDVRLVCDGHKSFW